MPLRTVEISCGVYAGNEELVASLQELVSKRVDYQEMLQAIVVHGSFGNEEVIDYSDFDGLLIIREEYRNTALLKDFLRRSLRLIYQFDPLQHHSWFFVYDSQFNNWPVNYFPPELFAYAKVIFPATALECTIEYDSAVDYQKPLHNLLTGLERKLANNHQPTNLYQLKSFLSEIMLLPTLYYQAKHQKAIFKKFSFPEVKDDFSEQAWRAIELSSTMRSNWHYQLNFIQRFFMTIPSKLFRRLTKLVFAPGISKKYQGSLEQLLDGPFEKTASRDSRSYEVIVNREHVKVH